MKAHGQEIFLVNRVEVNTSVECRDISRTYCEKYAGLQRLVRLCGPS